MMWNSNIVLFEKESVDNMADCYWNGQGQMVFETTDIDTELKQFNYSDVIYEYLIEGILEEIID